MPKTRRAGFRKKRRRGGRKTITRKGGKRRSRVTKRGSRRRSRVTKRRRGGSEYQSKWFANSSPQARFLIDTDDEEV